MSRHVKSLVVMIAAGLLLGSGNNDTVSSEQYMTTVCTVLSEWNHAMEEPPGDSTSPVETKKALAAMFDDLIDRSKHALRAIEVAGVPRIDRGSEIASTLRSGFGKLVATFERARTTVDTLPTDDSAAFSKGVNDLQAVLQDAAKSLDASLERAHSPALDEIAAKTEACASIQF